MKCTAAGLTDIGRVKAINQDTILLDDDIGLYMVCDGVSSGTSGELASATTAKIIHDLLSENIGILRNYSTDATVENYRRAVALIEHAVQAACEEIYTVSRREKGKSPMCTTVVLLVAMGQHAIVANVGDSRMYLMREGEIHLLTEDHTLANYHVRAGYSPDSLKGGKESQILTRAIGFQPSVAVEMLHFALAPGDMMLLCSDGLSNYLHRDDLTGLFPTVPLAQLPVSLVELANSRGGSDNISAVVIRADGDSTEFGRNVANITSIMARNPLFSRMTYRELLRVMNIVTLESRNTGQKIITEGHAGDVIYLNLSGVVEIRKKGQRIAELPAGSSFGEMCIMGQSPRTADVFAVEPALLMAIRRDDLFPILRADAHLATKFLWGLASILHQRLASTSEELSYTLAGKDIEAASLIFPVEPSEGPAGKYAPKNSDPLAAK